MFSQQDILKDAMETGLTSATEIPYFEGDFWPNVIEESIKELDDEEEEKRKREEAEAAAAEAEAEAQQETLEVPDPATVGQQVCTESTFTSFISFALFYGMALK